MEGDTPSKTGIEIPVAFDMTSSNEILVLMSTQSALGEELLQGPASVKPLAQSERR